MTTISRTIGAALYARAPVDYTDRIKSSGRKQIDSLLAGGSRWWHTAGADGSNPAGAARHALTYSFLTSADPADANGFQELSSAQKQRVRDALDYISSVADLTFTEVSSGGDIRYGSNTQASSAGYARYPNEGAQVFLANNQASFQGDWANGSYAWETLLHETAHALGLKHPGAYNAGGGSTPGPYLPAAQDNRGNSVMSYHDAKDARRIVYQNNQFQVATVNPDTYQVNDIAALQYLYGAAQSQARTYSWAADAAFSQTIYNSNGASTIDLSNQTRASVVDLRAGRASSIARRDAYADMPFSARDYAALTSGGVKLSRLIGTPTYTGTNNLKIAAGSHINHAVGGSGTDSFVTNLDDNSIDGGDGDDSIFVTGGNAVIEGGNGNDTVYVIKRKGAVWDWSDDRSTLTLTRTDPRTRVVTTLATITTTNVEQVKYWKGTALKASSPLAVA